MCRWCRVSQKASCRWSWLAALETQWHPWQQSDTFPGDICAALNKYLYYASDLAHGRFPCCGQAATDMFVMLLDVHKWVAMPAVAARVRQAGSTADPSTPKGNPSHLRSWCSVHALPSARCSHETPSQQSMSMPSAPENFSTTWPMSCSHCALSCALGLPMCRSGQCGSSVWWSQITKLMNCRVYSVDRLCCWRLRNIDPGCMCRGGQRGSPLRTAGACPPRGADKWLAGGLQRAAPLRALVTLLLRCCHPAGGRLVLGWTPQSVDWCCCFDRVACNGSWENILRACGHDTGPQGFTRTLMQGTNKERTLYVRICISNVMGSKRIQPPSTHWVCADLEAGIFMLIRRGTSSQPDTHWRNLVAECQIWKSPLLGNRRLWRERCVWWRTTGRREHWRTPTRCILRRPARPWLPAWCPTLPPALAAYTLAKGSCSTCARRPPRSTRCRKPWKRGRRSRRCPTHQRWHRRDAPLLELLWLALEI